jgi:hypothetical protein
VTTLVHIPFSKGQVETADPKLLPNGLLREAINVRLRADGRMGMRYGYEDVGVDVLSDSDVTPHDLAAFGDQQLLLASGDRTLVRVETSDSWKALDDASAAARSLRILSDVEPIARPPLQNQSRAADVAVNTAGYAAMVWTVPLGAVRHVVALVVRISDGVVLCHQRVDQTEDAEAVRVIALGTKFFLLHVDDATTNLECWTLDTATEGAFTLASASLIASAGIHNSYDFDARANGSSEFVVAWRSSGTEISWENFSSALATVGSRQTVTANGKLSVDAINNGHVAIVNITSTGTVECRTWNEAAQTLVSTTTIDAGTDAVGQPWVELLSGTVAMVSWGATAAGVNATHAEWNYRTINPTSHALGTLGSIAGARPASGSFFMPSGETGLWLVDTDSIERGYTLARFGSARTPEPEGLIAKPFAATAALVNERRSKVVSLAAALGATQTGAFVWAALTLPPNADPTAAALDTVPTLYRFEVERQKRVQRARLGGNLYFAGGLVTLFDGARYYEQDWCSTPTFDEMLAQTGAGDLVSESIYTYARVLEWTDAQNQRIFSAPSTPVQATLAAGNNTVRFEVSPPFTRKLDAAMGGASVNDIVYRSKTDGTVLRELTRFKWSRGQTTPQSFTDDTDDCGCDGKPIIYTQGNRGAVSGPLQNDAVNACDYIAAGRERIIIGRRDGVQWSLRMNETDAVGFTNNASFFKRIAGVTGVASLDERWLVCTKEAWYEVTGEGPDDDGVQGEFSAPRRIPAEGGCIDSRCMVEVSTGLIYQQSADRLYLMPRGGGSPVWFSQAVRATLAAFPVITSGVYSRSDNTVLFTCNNTLGTAGKLVVHDMRTGDWYVDELGGAPVVLGAEAWSGAHAICGASFVRLQTVAFADVADPISMRLRTGAIRPFGVNAWGKVHTVTLLGEFRGACTVACRFSFDDGQTFTALDSFAVTGTAGDAKRLQWSLPRTRTDHVVLEWTTTSVTPSEHIAFNAFTLEVEPSDGPPRLAAANRA